MSPGMESAQLCSWAEYRLSVMGVATHAIWFSCHLFFFLDRICGSITHCAHMFSSASHLPSSSPLPPAVTCMVTTTMQPVRLCSDLPQNMRPAADCRSWAWLWHQDAQIETFQHHICCLRKSTSVCPPPSFLGEKMKINLKMCPSIRQPSFFPCSSLIQHHKKA